MGCLMPPMQPKRQQVPIQRRDPPISEPRTATKGGTGIGATPTSPTASRSSAGIGPLGQLVGLSSRPSHDPERDLGPYLNAPTYSLIRSSGQAGASVVEAISQVRREFVVPGLEGTRRIISNPPSPRKIFLTSFLWFSFTSDNKKVGSQMF